MTADWWICATCAVEHADRPDVCAICADERQWVPAGGQVWTTLDELAADGARVEVAELEPDLFGLTVHRPSGARVGIGQQSKLVRTGAGMLLWDPVGYVDDAAVAAVRALGEVVVIAASHPHMYGVQVEWSRRLGGVPVLVAAADQGWVARPDPAVRAWSSGGPGGSGDPSGDAAGDIEVLPGVTLTQPGGHFPGSTVAHWAAGADGRGVLLAGDTIMAGPDRTSVAFMRSYPNLLPLSGAVALRVAAHVGRFTFDRLYSNFENVVPADARGIVQRSAARHAAWTRGDFDHLT